MTVRQFAIPERQLGVVWLFFVIAALTGGASRADEFGQLVVRLAAVGLLATVLIGHAAIPWRSIRFPLAILAAAAALVLLQLVPLPPAIGGILPGRDLYRSVWAEAGVADRWHAISLTPDLTWNSFFSLLPAVAVLIAGVTLPPRGQRALLVALIVLLVSSALFGAAQVALGGGPYLYRVTNPGFPNGFFANRNHQSIALATLLPMLGVWGGAVHDRMRERLLASAAGLLLGTVLILVAGSRIGLILAVVLGVPGYVYFSSSGWMSLVRRHGRRGRAILWLVAAGVGTVIAVVLLSSKATALTRLFSVDPADDQRFRNMPAMLTMIRDSFPVGFGFGAFESVFRAYEPVASLGPTYFNHAHDDFLEPVIEAGIGGIALIATTLGWLLMRSIRAWRTTWRDRSTDRYQKLASVVLAMIAMASLNDYPLRTPLLAAIAMIAVIWIESHVDLGQLSAESKRTAPTTLGSAASRRRRR